MKKHYRHEHDCLNCGTELQGKFCHNCGQENLQIKESFGHMLNHAISDYFHFDHQFFHTLKPLLLQPGKLTIEYMNGRRAQYLHPVKMYIFISLVYFLLIFKTNHDVIRVNNTVNTDSVAVSSLKKKLDKNPNLTKAQKYQLINQLKATQDSIKKAAPIVKTTDKNGFAPIMINDNGDKGKDKDTDSTYVQYNISESKLPANERDGFWEHLVKEKFYMYKEAYGKDALKHFVEDVQHNIPKMMFVLLPLCALMVKIAFWKNRKYYVEHLIYTIHLHCFVFLFSAIVLVIKLILPKSWAGLGDWLTFGLTVYIIYYIYRSLRVLYLRSRWRTISKMVGMSLAYFLVFVICLVGLIAVTAASI
ncbi:MAG: DUF3667 domain-containing protein [Bacteroidota bacterium]